MVSLLRGHDPVVRALTLVALFSALASTPLFAQNRNAGEIRGTVLDQTGAAVPGAIVTVTNENTGVVTKFTSGGDGVYDAPSVEPGSYTITVAKQGFKQLVRSGIVLHVETITLDASLEIGSSSQQVTVVSSTPTVQTESSDRRSVITADTITELPNVNRSWYDLTGQLPGVNPGKGNQDASGEGVGINGSTSYLSSWLIDGGVGTLPVSQNPDFTQPPLDAIAEVNFNTSNFSAEYGTGTAVFNVITKSGTNQFHGAAYEFVQNDILSARNFFAQNKTPLRWNEYGGNVGGPIKRDKLFFFFAYQRNPSKNVYPSYWTYPTAAMRAGDFSAPGLPVVYDPNSLTQSGTTYSRTPFAGNQVPATRFDPVAAKIQSYFPTPNQAGLANNYYFPYVVPNTYDWYDGKLDFTPSTNNRLTGSILWVPYLNTTPNPNCPMDCYTEDAYETQSQITDVWTLSPSVVNEARVSFMREFGTWSSPNQGQNYPQKLGLNNAVANAFPSIYISGTVPTSITGGLAALLGFNSYVTSDTVTLVKGRHILKLGGELDKWQQNLGWDNQRSGNFFFNGIFTRNPANPTSSGGLGYADFLVGLPDAWTVNNPLESGWRDWNVQAFVQDDYKIRPNLTLNLGVRYQYQTGWTERHNLIANFDPSLTNPATGTLGALSFAGQNGPRALQNTVPDFFAPRIGFAWSPRQKWSVRGGYGIFGIMWGANSYTPAATGLGTAASTNGFEATTDNIHPIFSLAQGPPAATPPSTQNLSPALLNGQQIAYFPRNTPMAYLEQWNFDIQHELAKGLLVDAAYVGNRGVHLGFGRDINQVPASLLGPGNAQNNRPYPQYANINASLFDGVSSYNSLQLSVSKRVTSGFTFLANYTYSKMLDTGTGSGWGGTTGIDTWQNAYNWKANYGPSTVDLRHLLNGSFVYDLPFGSGKHFLNQGGIVNGVLGGWQLASTFQLHTGLPFTPVMGTANLSGALSGTWFPNRLASGTLSNPTIHDWYNLNAFSQPSPYTFGNSGRDILRGPGFANWNMSLAKNFGLRFLGEGGRLQIRADASNFLNHTNFGMPNQYIGSGAAGTITNALNPRNVQLGAKITF